MDDINSRIETLNSQKKVNFFTFGITILYFLALTVWAAPVVFFLPIIFSTMGIWSIDITHDNQPVYWISVVIFLLILVALRGFFRMRKMLRKEYKNIHGIDFLSFFYF